VAKRLQIKQKATEMKSHIFVRNHKTEFLEPTLNHISRIKMQSFFKLEKLDKIKNLRIRLIRVIRG